MVYLRIQGKSVSYVCTISRPLDYVLIGCVLCVGEEIVERHKQEVFKNVCIYFGEETIKIFCCCEVDKQNEFFEIVSSCYILKNLKFNVKVEFR